MMYAASVGAATTPLRTLATGLLPFADLNMYASVGLSGGNTLLAGIDVVVASVLFVCRYEGAYLRVRFTLKL